MSKTRTCRSRVDRSTLIKAQISAGSYVAAERGTSDKTEATRFSQCAHDQRRRLEAEDCDSIRCAQLISGGRRSIHPPYCLAHARPTMCCICLVGASVSEPHTYGVAGAEMRNIFIGASVSEPPLSGYNAAFSLSIYIYIYIYIYVWYIVRHL